MILDPVSAYERVAPVYLIISAQRRPYLDAIDRLVVANVPEFGQSLLDVGAGDGRRALKIAGTAGFANLTLLEPAPAMRRCWPAHIEAWTARAEELGCRHGRFDAITCLWNVLGHIRPGSSRVGVLRQFARLLSPNGMIFIDVNHRYNVRAYGLLRTFGRVIRDLLFPSETNGDVLVSWMIEGEQCVTTGHVFTDQEFRALAAEANLAIEQMFVVDYSTGEQCQRSYQGHLLYLLRHRTDSIASTTLPHTVSISR